MLKRVIWLAVGTAIGWVWGFLSLRALERRVKSRLAPSSIADSAAQAGERVVARVATAVEAGRVEARNRESQLRRRLDRQFDGSDSATTDSGL